MCRKAHLFCMLTFVVLAGCANPPTRGETPPPNRPTPWIYDIVGHGVSVDGERYPMVREGNEICVDVNGLRVCTNPDGKGVLTVVQNGTEEEVSLLWPDSRWIDENGSAHSLVVRLDGRSPVQIVPAGGERREVSMPKEKVYLVDDGANAYYYSENMIPWNQRGDHPDDARRRLASENRSFFYTLVLRKEDARVEVTFEYKIIPKHGGSA